MNKLKVIYVGYPYTDDPKKRAEEIRMLIEDLVEVRQDIIPIVPHLAFDAIWLFPEGYDKQFVLVWELEVIAHCGGVCFPEPLSPAKQICGVLWERAFAKWLKLPEYDYYELLEGKELDG
jgi:hypothetical protein